MTARAIAPPFFFTFEVGLEATPDFTEFVRASESRGSSVVLDNTSDVVVVVVGDVVDGAAVEVDEAEIGEVGVVHREEVILCTFVVVVVVVVVVDGDVGTVDTLVTTASVAVVLVVVVEVMEDVVVVVEEDSGTEPAAFASLLQLDSSDASSQSGVPSQTQDFGIQFPSPQWNTVVSSAHVERHVVLSVSRAIPNGHLQE